MDARAPAACLLLLAFPVVAHGPSEEATLAEGTYLHHTNLHEGTLDAGAWNNTTLAWGGTPLREGWFLLWTGQVEGLGALGATVVHHNETVRTWTWRPGDDELVVHRLNETGFYGLRLHNPGPGPVRFSLYYDNTCDCTSKAAQGEESPLWFNYDLMAPGRVAWDVSIVPFEWPKGQGLPPVGHVDVEATVATWRGPGDAWPEDFQLVETFDLDLAPEDEATLRTLDMGFTAQEAGTHYILLTLHHDGDPRWMFQVRPVVVLPEGKEAPGPGGLTALVAGGLAGLAVLALAGAAIRRLRGRP